MLHTPVQSVAVIQSWFVNRHKIVLEEEEEAYAA